MTFTPGIPDAGHTPAFDQPLMLGNFTKINTFLGLEHQTLTGTGKHKYINLVRVSGAPAPAGTDGQISLENTGLGSQYVRFRDSSGEYGMTLTITRTVVTINGTVDAFDFAGRPSCAGYALIFDNGFNRRTLMSPFVFRGGFLSVPSFSTPAHPGQLPSGTQLEKFDNAGSRIQIKADAVYNCTLLIMLSPL